jgi:hypothetical protein
VTNFYQVENIMGTSQESIDLTLIEEEENESEVSTHAYLSHCSKFMKKATKGKGKVQV